MFFSLLYVPIVVGIYLYFGVSTAGVVLSVLGVCFALLGWWKEHHLKAIITPSIAIFLGLSAYFSSDFLSLKLYPLLISLLFLSYFTVSVVMKRYIIIRWVEKFKKRPLTLTEREDVIISHWFWIAVLGLNSAIHLMLVMNANLTFWALYSFAGWYLLFGCAMILQLGFAHRRDLIQWGRNGWGYGLFAGVIVMGFTPAMVGYSVQLLTHHPKPHVIFQRVTATMFRLFFRFAPGTARVELFKSDAILRDTPYIYAASHESWLDYPLMGAYITDLYHLTNKKKAFVWIIRPIAILLGVIDGVGGNPLHQLLLKLRSKSNVLIFPEGSRSHDGEIHPFKNGAFSLSRESGVPIVPVIISGTKKLVQKGSMNWSSTKGVVITITMLEPMMIAEDETLEMFKERVWSAMSAIRG
ncbi:MAG: lysophospholipid acyltransferase family protein [Sulfuricurvum sp.]|uniref:lysophospholipid acyltransferase family protein n=1 Tax=Sulfuricurvum sp. TaxID=2025608 RepID=UPI00261C2968|nr:lysophospholipid acyltransferase family protein [Sulfuricurvum sp.]MDD2829460.1 lysophospholipid acyltransferase family protein [Sulfuricurvum sp.]MDD4948457.1 lysophospholipid acyltransferase family protein [Sulfuricurvum sp.]